MSILLKIKVYINIHLLHELQLPENESHHPALVAPPEQFHMINLHDEFQTLLTQYTSNACSKCQSIPKVPAICLFCGTLVCMVSACCSTKLANGGTISETAQVIDWFNK